MGKSPIYRSIIQGEYVNRVSKNTAYSLRAYAKDLNINSGALSQIISGKRIISYKVALRICDALKLESLERKKFLYSLAQAYESQNLKRKSPEFTSLLKNESNTLLGSGEIGFDEFKVISSWYYTAILEMTYLDNFQSNAKWIANQLGISHAEAKVAIDNLLELGLLALDKDNKLFKTKKQLVTSNTEKTSMHHKERQKQILKKSALAIDSQNINQRCHSSMTMAINPAKIPLVKEEIQVFMSRICDLMETGERTELFELNINLFSLLEQRT